MFAEHPLCTRHGGHRGPQQSPRPWELTTHRAELSRLVRGQRAKCWGAGNRRWRIKEGCLEVVRGKGRQMGSGGRGTPPPGFIGPSLPLCGRQASQFKLPSRVRRSGLEAGQGLVAPRQPRTSGCWFWKGCCALGLHYPYGGHQLSHTTFLKGV